MPVWPFLKAILGFRSNFLIRVLVRMLAPKKPKQAEVFMKNGFVESLFLSSRTCMRSSSNSHKAGVNVPCTMSF